MKRIYILRHGKSDWEAAYGNDHERPLAARGRRAAKAIGRYLAGIGELPDLVLASSAVRATDTAEIARRKGGWACDLRIEEDLYDTTPETLLRLIQSLSGDHDCVMLVGHEPTCSAFLDKLIGGAQVAFPTCALARIDCDVETWHEVEFGGGCLAWLVLPRLLQTL